MPNNVNLEISANIGGLADGLKRGSDGLKKLGDEAKKSSSSIKSLSGAANSEKKVINQLALQYHTLTDAEKKAFGSDIKSQMDAHIAKLKEYKAVQADINAQVNGATSQFGKFGSVVSQAGSQLGLPIDNLTSLLNPTTAAIAGVAALGTAFVATAKSSEEFNDAMDDFKNRIRLNEQEVEMFKKEAIELGNDFGKSGTDIVKQFNNISQQLPGIQKDKKGLIELTAAVNKLAIGMSSDLSTATNAAVTVMSKWNLSAREAANVTNVIAESSRNSGASLEYQTAVFEKVGVAASAVGISYQEIAAATSLLSSTFADAGQVGQGLSLLITKMAKQKNEFNPAVVGMQKALKNLADAHLSYDEIVGMVGPKGAQVVQALIQQQDAFDKLTEKMKNTQAAEEMFGIKSEELGQVINRIKTLWENFLLKVGESQVFKTIMDIISDICKWIEQLSKDIQQIYSQNGDGFVRIWQQLREVISALLPIIGVILKAFIALYNNLMKQIGTLVDFISKMIDEVYRGIVGFCTNVKNIFTGLYKGVTSIWRLLYAYLGDTKIMQNIVKAYKWLRDKVVSFLTAVAKKWNDFVGGLGLNELKINISSDDRPQQTTYDNNDGGGFGAPPAPTATIPTTPTSTSGKGLKGGGKATKQDAVDGSIEWYNQKIKEQKDLLNSKVQTEEKEREIIAEILRLEKERDEIVKRQENQRKWQEEVAKIASGEDKKDKKTSPELFMAQLPDLSKIKVEPIEVPIKPNLNSSDWAKDIEQVTGSLGNMVGALGAAFGGAGEDALAFASQTIQAIGQIIPQIVALIGVKESEAMASGTASAAALPFPANLGAIATIVATIASIFAGLATFADGGIVKGSTTIGDGVLTRLNAGEVVLNGRQQANLWRAIDQDRLGGSGHMTLDGDVRIKGSDLYLALNNYNKITGKSLK